MSQDVLEIGALIAALVGLTALVHRVVRPILEHLVKGRPHPAGAAGAVGVVRSGLEPRPLLPRRAA